MLPDPTIYIVDDDHDARESLRWLIESVGLQAETYSSPTAFLEEFDAARPCCVILDVRMPELNGIDVLQRMREQMIEVPAILVTAYGDIPMSVQAMRAGAVDFIEKPYRDQQLMDRVNECLEQSYRQFHERNRREEILARFALLSPREGEVMSLLVDGSTNKETARTLQISPKTVEAHRSNLMKKMETNSIAALVRMGDVCFSKESP